VVYAVVYVVWLSVLLHYFTHTAYLWVDNLLLILQAGCIQKRYIVRLGSAYDIEGIHALLYQSPSLANNTAKHNTHPYPNPTHTMTSTPHDDEAITTYSMHVRVTSLAVRNSTDTEMLGVSQIPRAHEEETRVDKTAP
jgi:hypothetical protein